MKGTKELKQWEALQASLEKDIEIIYQLVGDHSIPDEDVKQYLNPFFEKSTALKYYVGAQVKNLSK